MRFMDVLPPVFLATMWTAVAFAIVWRGDQLERAKKPKPWYCDWLLIGHFLIMGAFFYVYGVDAPTNRIGVLGAALLAQAMAIIVLGTIAYGFWLSKGAPLSQRLFAMVVGTMLTLGMIAAMFY